MRKVIIATIVVVLIGILLFTLPISQTKEDIFFSVTVSNNILNQPSITSVEVDSRPATILPSSYVLASFYQSGDLTLTTQIGGKTLTKNIGELAIIDTPLSPKERTVNYRIAGVEKRGSSASNIRYFYDYKIDLKENGTIIDTVEGEVYEG